MVKLGEGFIRGWGLKGFVSLVFVLSFISLVSADCPANDIKGTYCDCPTGGKEFVPNGEIADRLKDPDSCCYNPPKPKVNIIYLKPYINVVSEPVKVNKVEAPSTPKQTVEEEAEKPVVVRELVKPSVIYLESEPVEEETPVIKERTIIALLSFVARLLLAS